MVLEEEVEEAPPLTSSLFVMVRGRFLLVSTMSSSTSIADGPLIFDEEDKVAIKGKDVGKVD